MTLQEFLKIFNASENDIKTISLENAMEAVKQNGNALRYVKEQTESICMEAVKQDGYTLRYVKEQTESICMEAVKQDGYALQYVDKRIFTNN
jgi:ribosomal protein S2